MSEPTIAVSERDDYQKATGPIPLHGRLISTSEYVKALRPHLPPEAFVPNNGKIFEALTHYVLVVLLIYGSSRIPFIPVKLILALVIGHSITCMGFIAHEISHGTVLRGRTWRYVLETILWAPFLMPASVWRRMHNEIHHHSMNTREDCDRVFLEEEKSVGTAVYNAALNPRGNPVRWNPVVFTQFIVYGPMFTGIALTLGLKKQDPPSLYIPYFGLRRAIRVTFDIAVLSGIQYGFYLLAGGTVLNWLLVCLFPAFVASALGTMYINTNHVLNPITTEVDPVQGSLSLKVPSFFNFLHSNFAYHTEHHLFPGMNSKYYPAVSALLKKMYPERYNRMTLSRAWYRLWNSPAYVTPAVEPERAGTPQSTE